MARTLLLVLGLSLLGAAAFAAPVPLVQQFDFSQAPADENKKIFTNNTAGPVDKQVDTSTTAGGPLYLVVGPCDERPEWNDDGAIGPLETPTDSREVTIFAGKCLYVVEKDSDGGTGGVEVG